MENTAKNQRNEDIAKALIELGANHQHIYYLIERIKSTSEEIDNAALDMGLISPELIAKSLAMVYGYPYFSANNADTINIIGLNGFINEKIKNYKFGKFSGFIPVGVKDGKLVIAISNIEQNNFAKRQFFDFSIATVFASQQTIQKVYRLYFSDTKSDFMECLQKIQKPDGLAYLEEFFCTLLKHGCYYGANDIKMRRSKKAGMIAFKKEGRGELLCSIPTHIYTSILDLILNKTSNADQLKFEPKESKIDGTFVGEELRASFSDIFSRYVFRVQLYMRPDSEWVSVVIRINDSQSQVTDFSSLDFDADSKYLLRKWINSPTGLIFVTGPTGSGKTSVLYSLLREIDPIERNVSTVENPIEYQNGMWDQKLMEKSQNRSESQMATLMLNSLLREAPDVILFGEIRRDLELLSSVIDASNTGHLVLTTMHTQNAPTTILRLLDIGADPKTIASSLMGVLSVRLIGLLCPVCKVKDDRLETYKKLKIDKNSQHTIYRSHGCPHCNGKGFRGRKMVYELLNCNKVSHLIEQGAKSIKEIESKGMLNNISMWDRAVDLVLNGLSSIDEAERRIYNSEED